MEYIVFALAMLVFLLIMMGKGFFDEQKSRKKFIQGLYDNYGTLPERKYMTGEIEEHIAMYYQKHPESGQLDDITWNDLHMDEIYVGMNYSHSAAGDEYLYYRLRTPFQNIQEMDAFEEKIQYFMHHEKERVAIQLIFAKLGRMSKYSLYEYLEYLNKLGERKSGKYYFAIFLVFISLGSMFVSVPFGLCLLLGVLCRNIMGYYKEQKEIDPYLTSFQYIFRLLDAAFSISKLSLSGMEAEQNRLQSCFQTMNGFRRNSFLVMSGGKGGAGLTSSNPLEMLLDYVRMIFYLDLIKFNQMLAAVQGHAAEIDQMVSLIGSLETAVVIGEYRSGIQNGYCIPEFVIEEKTQNKAEKTKSKVLEIKQFYHPLLQQPVKNDIRTKNSVLITGSNASGKSTFLRAAALNVIFAQTIHTCHADAYYGNVFHIYSSMSLRDDLESGDSYYMAEVKSIRRILRKVEEAEKQKEKVICFVDEVLRGTNTVERIAASTQILKALAGENVICFAATHDLELTKLLESIYENYHFEEKLIENDIFFPYCLQKGAAMSRNAIALLKVLGYKETLVAEAEEMAQNFLQSGKWQKEW